MTVQRVEKHILKEQHPYYAMLCDFTHKSKNLYNHANYIVRTEFCKNNKWVRYGELDKMLKADLEYDDYKHKRRRVHRGLFVSNEGRKINADVNGAMQIMKKVFPEVFADGIKGVMLHPIRVNIM